MPLHIVVGLVLVSSGFGFVLGVWFVAYSEHKKKN